MACSAARRQGPLGHFLARTEDPVGGGEGLESRLSSPFSKSGDLNPHFNTVSGFSGKRNVAFLLQ